MGRNSLQITAVIVRRDEQSQMRTNSLQITAVIVRRDEQSQMRTNSLQIAAVIVRRDEQSQMRTNSLQITAVIVRRDEQSQMRTNSLQITAVIIRRDCGRTCYKSLLSSFGETTNELVTNQSSHHQQKRMELTAKELVTKSLQSSEETVRTNLLQITAVIVRRDEWS